jgi:hypothetical protein
VPSISALPYPASVDYFSSWARIAVSYVDRARPMPVLRLDRDGLTVAVAVAVDDEADIPPIGLPRRALLVGGSKTLCELRVVLRTVARVEDGAVELTIQPSRADDHALLWLALRAYQLQLGPSPWRDVPARSSKVRGARTSLRQPRTEGAAAQPETEYDQGNSRARAWCDAAFTVANRDDGFLLAHWLEYYFVELCARARMHDARAELCDVHMRVADHEVEVRFVFRHDERVARASTQAVSEWVAAEAVRQLHMSLEHWLSPNLSAVGGLRTGRPYRSRVTSAARGYSS